MDRPLEADDVGAREVGGRLRVTGHDRAQQAGALERLPVVPVSRADHRICALCHDRRVDPTWTSQQCAQEWGVRTPTWLGYVSRGQAPRPLPGDGPKRWDPDAVRSFPRPGAGRSRAAASGEVVALLDEMAEVTAQLDDLRTRQRALARAGKAAGGEVRAMARALGVSPQTVYGWLED